MSIGRHLVNATIMNLCFSYEIPNVYYNLELCLEINVYFLEKKNIVWQRLNTNEVIILQNTTYFYIKKDIVLE